MSTKTKEKKTGAKTLVEVRPIERQQWHGKTDKENFAQAKTIEVLYDSEKGGYATGLTDKEQEEYEKLTGLDLSSKYDPEEPHPYWSSKGAQIKLPNRTIVFDTSNPVEAIKVKNLKASKFVANSLKEYEEGMFPEATHVIFDEQEEVEIKATKIAQKNECVKLLLKMSATQKENMIQILSNESARGRSAEYLDVQLDKLIESDPIEFLKYAKMDKEEATVRAQVLECILKNILTKEGTSVYYMGDIIGYDTEEAITWFMNPQNQKMKVAILEKLAE